jgi:hypothetical protein
MMSHTQKLLYLVQTSPRIKKHRYINMISAHKVIWLALLSVLAAGSAVPLLGHAQLEEPTSSISMPTSSITQPDETPEAEPVPGSAEPAPGSAPQIFGSNTPYPYPEPRFDTQTTRILFLTAGFLVLAGILLFSGTFERLFFFTKKHPARIKKRST